MRKPTLSSLAVISCAIVLLVSGEEIAFAQTGLQFQPTNMTPLPGTPQPNFGVPMGAPAGAPMAMPNGALQTPNFGSDPYSVRTDMLGSPQVYVPPGGQTYQNGFPAQPFGQQQFAYPGQPLPGQFPTQQPGAFFPQGIPIAGDGPQLRLFQDLRFRYTWLGESGAPDDMEISKLEIATTMNYPNFLWSGQPIQISPGFAGDFWGGPNDPLSAMPGSAYSAYLDFAWKPVVNDRISGDISVRPGIYSDYNSITLDKALRITGTGLLIIQLTPTLAAKGGIEYLDRRKIKLLPAGGLVWRPSPKTYFDIYFPRPKIAAYLFTVGNTHVWWYVGAEYGGGTWEIEDPFDGNNIDVDINDIRVFGGFEWTGGRGLNGFIEGGYVFNRELDFGGGNLVDTTLSDTFMIRAGLSY